MTTRTAIQTAFQIILAAIFYATTGQGPTPVRINWDEERPMYMIQEYNRYFQYQREYQEKEYLLIHYNLGVKLFHAAEEYSRTAYEGPLIGGTMTGTIEGDMYKTAKEVAGLSDYHAKAAVRLWLMFYDNPEVLYKVTRVSVAQVVHLKEEEVGHLYEAITGQRLDYCPLCAEHHPETSDDEEESLFEFPMSPDITPRPSPTISEATTYLPSVTEVLTHPPYANSTDGHIMATPQVIEDDHEPVRFINPITVIDMQEIYEMFDPLYDSDQEDDF